MSKGKRERGMHAPVSGVSVCVVRDGRIVLVKRAKAAARGLWSLPGGHVRFGEELKAAALRELVEETGIEADIVRLLDCIDIINKESDGRVSAHYVLSVYGAVWRAGEPVAASDVSQAQWVAVEELDRFAMTPGTAELIRRAVPLITKN